LAKTSRGSWLLLAISFVAGILVWGGFNTAMEWTNRESFCISCHEMRDYLFTEYKRTVHYHNGSGVRATCPDCHVPRDWLHKVERKVMAVNELFHKITGSISSKARFEARREQLGEQV